LSSEVYGYYELESQIFINNRTAYDSFVILRSDTQLLDYSFGCVKLLCSFTD